MKILLLLGAFLAWQNAFAVCDSVISRTNNSANAVLTSTKYNTDLNTVYTRVNELPGDCVTDGTLEYAAIDQTTFQPAAKGIKEGCAATYSDANTISIDKCLIAVSGTQIEKTTATTVTWGCSGCSAEVVSTTYYVYATSASTLTLKISTTAPDAYGYNGTDRVLARFYNNASSAIDQWSIDNWASLEFRQAYSYLGNLTFTGSWVTNTTYTSECWRRRDFLACNVKATLAGAPTATALLLTLPTGLVIDAAKLELGNTLAFIGTGGLAFDNSLAVGNPLYVEYQSVTTQVAVMVSNAAGTYIARAAVSATVPFTFANLDTVQVEFTVPIVGWNP